MIRQPIRVGYRGASMQLSIAVINVAAQQRICHALIAASAGSPGKYMARSFT